MNPFKLLRRLLDELRLAWRFRYGACTDCGAPRDRLGRCTRDTSWE